MKFIKNIIFTFFIFTILLSTSNAQINGIGVNAGVNLQTGQWNGTVQLGGGGNGQQNGRPLPQGQQQSQQTSAGGGGGITRGQYQRGNTGADLSFFSNLVVSAGSIIKLLPPILMSLAVVVFFWSLIQMIRAKKDGKEEETKKYTSQMGWSLVALFVMVTLWGIIAFAGDIIGINPNVQVSAPALPR